MKQMAFIICAVLLAGCDSANDGTSAVGSRRDAAEDSLYLVEIGARSDCGTLNGIPFESYAVAGHGGNIYWIYLCYRQRNEDDLTIGEVVYGAAFSVSEHIPDTVIDRIALAVRKGPFGDIEYFQFPSEMYKDVTNPNFGGDSNRGYSALALNSHNLVVYHRGSDGAGSYTVNWIVDIKNMKVTRIIQGHEMPTERYQAWVALEKIKSPDIQESDKPVG